MPPAGTLKPQVLVWLKMPGPVLDVLMLLRLTANDPGFVRVTFCVALAVFCNWLPKASDEGETVIFGVPIVTV